MNRVTTNCPACVDQGEQGSCAAARCYCGHPQCWAYPTWRNTRQAPDTFGASTFNEDR
jgi:hypothetical protein